MENGPIHSAIDYAFAVVVAVIVIAIVLPLLATLIVG